MRQHVARGQRRRERLVGGQGAHRRRPGRVARQLQRRRHEASRVCPARFTPRPRGAQAGSLRSGRALAGRHRACGVRREHQPQAAAIRMQREFERMLLVRHRLLQQVGLHAGLAQKVGRRVVREADPHRVEQRERDEQEHADDAREQVAPRQRGARHVDVEPGRDQRQRAQREHRLPGGIDREHEPEPAERDDRRHAGAHGAPPVERVHGGDAHLTRIRALAPSRASCGDWRMLVTASSAASIAVQNLPTSGMLGTGSPRRALSIVAAMCGSLFSSAK